MTLPAPRENAPADLADIADLTQAVAHELNNVLNNVVLLAAVIEQSAPNLQSETKSLAANVREAGSMVHQLQQVCRQYRPALEPVDLNVQVREVVKAANPKCAVDMELADSLPKILGHSSEVRRIVKLLLDQASALAARQVVVRTERRPGGALLTVADDGPPADPEGLDRLGEPFRWLRGKDDGMPLTCCRSVARRLQATFQAENRPEGGISFHINFRACEK